MEKISIIGAGNVGANIAVKIAEHNLADEIVLLDIYEGIARGKALDLAESSPIMGYQTGLRGTGNYKDIQNSRVVVITAGYPRTPGMLRKDLLEKNSEIIYSIAQEIKENSPEAIVINVTNPLDEMTYLIYATGNFPADKVLGMAGVLDSSRLRYFIAEFLKVNPQSVEAMVLGGHGETMVPLMQQAKVNGELVSGKIPAEKIEEIIERTRKAGAEIVSLLGKGSAFYAPSAAVYEMVKAVIEDKQEILPCSVYLSGEYGVKDCFLGVPVRLGRRGVMEVIEMDLDAEEKRALEKSAEITRRGIEEVKIKYGLK